MTKKAVDIVLLLPEDIRQEAFRINQQLDTGEIDFAEKDIHPHITLLMGCLEEQDGARAAAVLGEIAQATAPLRLQIKRVVNKGSVSFEIEKTPLLQDLHERLIQKCQPFLSYEATTDMFYRPGEVRENAVGYVSNFLGQASNGNFWPHVTLGYGDHPEEEVDLAFTAFRLALCHLGKHCTCREILEEVRLGN